MSGEVVLEALGFLEPDLVEEADRGLTRSRRSRLLPLAAVLAAVLAAAALLMGAAGALIRFRLLTGAGAVQEENRFSVDFSGSQPPVRLENGRLIFTGDGQHVDITDRVDRQTPYVYETVNAGRVPTYLIVGGTPDRLGYAEVWVNRGVAGVALREGDSSVVMELTAEDFSLGWRSAGQGCPWFLAAMERLEPEIEARLAGG